MTKLLLIIIFSVFIFSPFVFVSAQNGIVPCGGEGQPDCDFNQLIILIQSIINFLLFIAAPIAAVMFAYAGWLYLSAAGNQGQVEKAHKIFTTVFMGIVIALAAWLIVNVISTVLLKPDFISIKN